MSIVPTLGNLYPGLSEGPIQADAKVINAINGALVARIGTAVEVDTIAQGTPVGALLPEVSAIGVKGGPTIGIEVGGVRKGIYDDLDDVFSNNVELILKSSTLIAVGRESVRVCTQGVCLAHVLTRTNSDIKIGDSLTSDVFIDLGQDFVTNGFLVKATPGDFVIARALQPIPVGTPTNPQARTAAVDVQREGKL